MAVRPILLFPDPALKKISQPVNNVDIEKQTLLKDLADTLYDSPGVGLAAPQIGSLWRAIVVDVTRPPRSGRPPAKGHGLLTLLNPRIVRTEGDQFFREGCLSIPEFLANVKRAAWIAVEAIDGTGNVKKIETDGFEAVALQHEIDHLDGVLFLDRVANVKTDLVRRGGRPLAGKGGK